MHFETPAELNDNAFLHRSLTVVDASTLIDGASLGAIVHPDSFSAVNYAFDTMHVRNVEAMMFGVHAANDTCVASCIGFNGPIAAKAYQKAALLWTATWKLGLSSGAPWKDDSVWASGTTFLQADTITITVQNTGITLFDASDADGQAGMMWWPRGFRYNHIFVTTLTGITDCRFTVRRVG